MAAQQKALYLESPHNGPFVLKEKPVPKPGPGQILVQLQATALNPVDWRIRAFNFLVETYPVILGLDAAGTVESVGEGVQDFAKGDRVVTQGTIAEEAATYQQHIVVPAELASKIPSTLSFDDAAALPTGLVAATTGLYLSRPVGAETYTPPWEEGGKGKYKGRAIIVSGGAGSVGQYVIQLAKLSGFSPIIATASAHNKELLLSLGATHVIDRSSGDPFAKIKQLLTTLNATASIVFDTVSTPETQSAFWDSNILGPNGQLVLVHQARVDKEKYKNEGKIIFDVFGISHFPHARALCTGLFKNVKALLEGGSVKPNPIEVLPGGLSAIPDGLERIKEDKVSGKKLVVRPTETA